MSNYQKVIRGRDSLGKLREMADKTGIRKPMIIGTEPLISTLMKKIPGCFLRPFFLISTPIRIWPIPRPVRHCI